MTFSGKVEVAPGSIRSALAEIWSETARSDASSEPAGADQQKATRVRATLANLIMLLPPTPDESAKAETNRLIEGLCIAHPSRFFVIEMLPGDGHGNELRTAVSSRCVLARSGSHVCSEEVYISARPDAASHVVNLLLANLVPDVAAHFIVLGDPLLAGRPNEAERVLELIGASDRMSDRVIFDSSQFEEFGSCLRALLSQRRAASTSEAESSFGVSGIYGANNYKFRDTNWRRMRRWRSLIREQFYLDRIAAALPRLHSIELASADPAAAPRVGADAALLGAWITRCLGGDFASKARREDDRLLVEFEGADEKDERRRIVFLGEPAEGVRAGTLIELRFVFGGQDQGLVLSLRRLFQEDRISVSVEENSTSELMRQVAFGACPLADLVLEDIISNDSGTEFGVVFEAAIALAERIGTI